MELLQSEAVLAQVNRKRLLPLADFLQTVAFVAKSLSDENLVSHHLKELRRSLLVKVERRGPFVYYEIADARILQIVAALKDLATDLLAARTTF
jgi:DNA-binding transcriptional ArsR family regulator